MVNKYPTTSPSWFLPCPLPEWTVSYSHATPWEKQHCIPLILSLPRSHVALVARKSPRYSCVSDLAYWHILSESLQSDKINDQWSRPQCSSASALPSTRPYAQFPRISDSAAHSLSEEGKISSFDTIRTFIEWKAGWTWAICNERGWQCKVTILPCHDQLSQIWPKEFLYILMI